MQTDSEVVSIFSLTAPEEKCSSGSLSKTEITISFFKCFKNRKKVYLNVFSELTFQIALAMFCASFKVFIKVHIYSPILH